MLSNPFYDMKVTLVSKFDKYVMSEENYRPVSLINIGAGILNKLIIFKKVFERERK